MAARLNDTKFVDRLNRFLRDIRADGRYKQMRQKHLRNLPDGSRYSLPSFSE